MTAQSTTERKILDAVEDGANTTDDLVAETGRSKGHVQKVLKSMTERGVLDRVRGAHGFTYEVPDEPGNGTSDDAGEWDTADHGLMPVNRDYDWSAEDYRPTPDGDYVASGDELVRLMSLIRNRHETGAPVRDLVGGDSGIGKTLFCETVADINAAHEDVVWLAIQFSKDMDDADLFGAPSFAGGSTTWVDGTLTKAMLAAREGKVVHLHLDELNRAPAFVHNALFEALDHRGAVRLDGPRGGEVISADPLNIVVTATLNEGDEYHGTERMDLAARGRFTTRRRLDYLALKFDPSDPDAPTEDMDEDGFVGVEDEARLLVERRSVPAELARNMVRAAAEVRADAADSTNTTVEWGFPARALLAWGGAAAGYAATGEVANPLVAAAEDSVIRTYYGEPGEEKAGESVKGTIEAYVDGAPWDPDEFENWSADEVVICRNCSWSAPKPKAEEQGVLATLTCPDCGSDEDVDVRSK